jgi:hypothetical protein
MTPLLLAALCLAQPVPGDLVVSAWGSPSSGLFTVDPASGQPAPINLSSRFGAAWLAEDNRDLLCAQVGSGAFLRVTPAGSLTSVGGPWGWTGFLEPDQDGSYVGVDLVGPSTSFSRWTPGAGVVPITGLSPLVVATIDGDTGHYYAVGQFSLGFMLYRVDRTTGAYTTIRLTGVGSPAQPAGLVSDPARGDFLILQLGSPQLNSPQLLRVDRHGSPPTPFVNDVVERPTSLRRDPETGRLLVAGDTGQLALLAADGTVIARHSFPGYMIRGAEFYGTRKVSGAGRATPGADYPLSFSFPGSPGRPYLAVLSTGLRPGITLPDGRTIQIDVTSPIFALSLGGLPGITTGFAGTLDGSGRASATVRVLAGLPAGTRFFATAVALNPTSPSGVDIANTWGWSYE